jgi:hypothetical protein
VIEPIGVFVNHNRERSRVEAVQIERITIRFENRHDPDSLVWTMPGIFNDC